MKVCAWLFETYDMDGRIVSDPYRLADSNRFGGDEECRWYSGDLVAITAKCRTTIACNLSSIHVQNHGWVIWIDALQAIPAPCLLTDDAGVHLIYDGPTRMRMANKSKPFYSRTGLPLLGSEWFGFAFGIGPRPFGTEMKLIAFSSKVNRLPAISIGRYPGWDDAGDYFEITLA